MSSHAEIADRHAKEAERLLDEAKSTMSKKMSDKIGVDRTIAAAAVHMQLALYNQGYAPR